MNTTFETVWELSTARIPWGLRPIIPCITLNFPNVAPPTRGFNYVSKNACKQVGIPTKARAGFSLKGWLLRGRPLWGFGKHFRRDLTGLNKIRRI